MLDQHIKLLERHGWEIECESPREIRHTETGSFATLWAADAVIESLVSEEAEEELVERNKAYALTTEAARVIMAEITTACKKINPLALAVMPVMFVASKNMLSEYLTFVKIFSRGKKVAHGTPGIAQEAEKLAQEVAHDESQRN